MIRSIANILILVPDSGVQVPVSVLFIQAGTLNRRRLFKNDLKLLLYYIDAINIKY